MKKDKAITVLVLLGACLLFAPDTNGQVLKKLGNRLKEKVQERADRKADAAMDKGLDEAEKGMDGALEAAADPGKGQENGQGSGPAGCANYYYLTQDGQVQMTAYDRKGDPAMIITYHISDVRTTAAGMESKVESEIRDMKEELVTSAAGTFKCEGGNLSADMKVAMSSAPMEQFGGMEMKAEQVYLVYPGKMSAGQRLPGAAVHMELTQQGRPFATVDYTVENRRVEAKEQVTTPAGSWDCYRIAYDLFMKIKMGIGVPVQYKVTEWFAPGLGIVKSEQYTKKGKRSSSAELTMISSGRK